MVGLQVKREHMNLFYCHLLLATCHLSAATVFSHENFSIAVNMCELSVNVHIQYYHLCSTVKRERFFRTRLFFKRDSFPENCIDWTNENVSFGARNYES